jgi:uncharacterized glyoxalase superfamily protein PhnB
MRRALSFYEASLGFRYTFKLEDELHPEIPYAIVERDEVELHLQLNPKAAGLSSCYVFLDEGADALHAEFQQAGVRITRPIEDSNYGARDFTIADATATPSPSAPDPPVRRSEAARKKPCRSWP